MQTDAKFCERVCEIAKDLGYTLDQMGSFQGWSFAFVAPDGKRVPGVILRNRERALVNACRELLPHIYLHIFHE